MNRKPSIHFQDLTIGYRSKKGQKTIGHNLKAEVYPGELTCLLGANGIGKSTLLKTLTKSLDPLSGVVYIGEEKLTTLSEKQLAKIVSVVLTERCDIKNMTARELINLGRSPYTGFWGTLSKEDHKMVDQAIQLVQIEKLAEQSLHHMSDGERQKVMIAKALAQDTPVIILDEPTAFLDFPSKVELMQLLHRLTRKTGKTIFLSTHDLELALQIADKVWLMDSEYGLRCGMPEDLALDGRLSTFFACKGIIFDRKSGLFRIENTTTKSIRVTGHRQQYAMLRKALLRNGIETSHNASGIPEIIIDDERPDSFTVIVSEQERFTVSTVEEVLALVRSKIFKDT